MYAYTDSVVLLQNNVSIRGNHAGGNGGGIGLTYRSQGEAADSVHFLDNSADNVPLPTSPEGFSLGKGFTRRCKLVYVYFSFRECSHCGGVVQWCSGLHWCSGTAVQCHCTDPHLTVFSQM